MPTNSTRKRTTYSDLQDCGVISPVNLDYNFDLNLPFSSLSAIAQTGRRECRGSSMCRLIARFDPQFYSLVPCSSLFYLVACCSPSFVLSAPKH